MDSRATSLFRDFDIPVYPPSLLVAFLVLLRTISVSYPQAPAQHKELWFHLPFLRVPISAGAFLGGPSYGLGVREHSPHHNQGRGKKPKHAPLTQRPAPNFPQASAFFSGWRRVMVDKEVVFLGVSLVWETEPSVGRGFFVFSSELYLKCGGNRKIPI